jgi:hypothetical protein
MSKTLSYIAIMLFIISYTLWSQEQGEFLRFDQRVTLEMTLTQTILYDSNKAVLYQSPPSDISQRPVQRILFNGTVTDTHLTLQIRYQKKADNWSDWENVYLKIFPNGRFWARFDVLEIETQQIQFRWLDVGVKLPVEIKLFGIEGIPSQFLKEQSEESHLAPGESKYFLLDTIPKPPLITRQQWGADPPIGAYIPHNPYRLTQHHTAGMRVSTLSEGIAEMQFIQNFHQYGRGWQDIGYHFCLDDSGRIYEGVPADYRGTHVGGANTGNVGISYMGNFQETGQFPTVQALQSLVNIWSWLAFHYGVNPDSLYGHRNYNATACPGDHLYSELPDLRTGMRQMLGFGAPYVANPFPQPFSTEIPPSTPIQFFLKDDLEGVDINSIFVRINGDTISPLIAGNPQQYQLAFQPASPFPYSQNVIVDVTAADLAIPLNVMEYFYRFKIEVEALYVEIQTATVMRNAGLEITGSWQIDNYGVVLPGLTSGYRLFTVDTDSSHTARIYPVVTETGDYNIFMAMSDDYLGESVHFRFINKDGYSYPHFAEYNSVYLNKWSLLSPTPVLFSADSSTNGYFELSGLPDINTRLVLDAFRLEKTDRLDPPHAPTLKWVRLLNPASKEIEIAWYPSLEGDLAGYRLFMSYDALNWEDPLADETVLGVADHVYQLTFTDTAQTVYFRVVAVDTNKYVNELGAEEPLVSDPTDAYGVGFNLSHSILIVDNFDRVASWSLPYHPFVASYGEALKECGHGFDSCTETAVQNGDISLMDYQMVIYFCGDDSWDDESLAAADQLRLLAYLEAGGKLFISGSEIGYDLTASTPDELNRYQYLLRARYLGDLAGSNHVLGEMGTVFEGLDFIYGTQNGANLYIEDYPDYLQPQYGSEVALFYDNLRIAGICYTGIYGASLLPAQLVYLGFTFETIITPADRTELLGRILTYFGLAVDIKERLLPIADRFELGQNFPNPFNPMTEIHFSLPGDLNNSRVKLDIFNMLGQKVRTLVHEKKMAGSHIIEWDGKNDQGMPAASGVYIYRLQAGSMTATRKMILLH